MLPFRGLTSKTLFNKYMDYIDKYAKIKENEKVTLMDLLTRKEEGIMLREALLQEGRVEGLEKGLEKGVILGKLEIVQSMFEQGIISAEAYQQISAPLQDELKQLEARSDQNRD